MVYLETVGGVGVRAARHCRWPAGTLKAMDAATGGSDFPAPGNEELLAKHRKEVKELRGT